MFRQDRTNPSSAVSDWKGRSNTPQGWPSTRVSTWLNGGLFGGGGEITGGDARVDDHGDGYIYEMFYSSGTMTATGPVTIDLLVCGGGGSAGKSYNSTVNSSNGGGGAGGWMSVAGLDVAAGDFNVTIGSGGAVPAAWNDIGVVGGDTSVPILLQDASTVLFGAGGGGFGGRGANYNESGGAGRQAPNVNDSITYSNAVGSGGAGGGGGVYPYNAAGNGGAGGASRSDGSVPTVTQYGGGTVNGAQAYWAASQGATGGSANRTGNGSPTWQPPDGLPWNSFPTSGDGSNYFVYSCGGASLYSGLNPSGDDYITDAANGTGNSQTYLKAVTGIEATSNGIIIARWAA